MTTLHIEHPISDYTTWREAFDRFQPLREQAGVMAQRICRPTDDDHYVVVQLDFTDEDRAACFATILRERIWNDPAASPALAGAPRTILLAPAE